MDQKLETHLSLDVGKTGINDIIRILCTNFTNGFKHLKYLGQFKNSNGFYIFGRVIDYKLLLACPWQTLKIFRDRLKMLLFSIEYSPKKLDRFKL